MKKTCFVLIRTYEHLGTGIAFEEADRMKNQLMDAIRTLLDSEEADSPVYTFLLDLRAAQQSDPDEAMADRVIARRVRKQVLHIVDATLAALPRAMPDQPSDPEEAYWLGATRLEAMLGLGMLSEMEKAKGKLFKTAPESWMRGSTDKQLEKLQLLLEAGAAKTMRQPGMIRQ